MDIDTIIRLLTNAGFHVKPDATKTQLLVEDPSCIMRNFETFMEYAWAFVCLITAFLLFGWAISLIRGAKTDITTNIRNLVIMFGVLTAAGPIVNVIYGDDLMAQTCQTFQIPLDEVQKILDVRNSQLSKNDNLFEAIDIFDSGMRTDSASGQNLSPVDVPEFSFTKDSETGEVTLNYTAPDAVTPVSQETMNTQTTKETVNNYAGNPVNTQNTQTHVDINVPVSARPISPDVIEYSRSDGTTYRHNGGSPSWRHKNPGNIINSPNSKLYGAIGRGKKFAIFPSEEVGKQAIITLLRSKSYRNLSILDAIRRYAPAADNNNPGKYARDLSRATGLDINRVINTLTDTEMQRVADEIQRIEGWKPGTVTQ